MSSGELYFYGAIIVSVAAGHALGAPFGWACFGAFLILVAMLDLNEE